MKNIVLTLGILTLTLGFIGCGAPAATNVVVKPTNTAAAANTATTNTATSNTVASNTAAAPAKSAADQDFTLVNKTGVIIDKLFISPADADDWEEDILGKDTLADGATLDIEFKRAEKAAKWDLKVEDSKGNSIEWTGLNLLEISKITLLYKDGKGTAETE